MPAQAIQLLGAEGLARIRRRLHERIHLRLAIVVDIGYARHGLETRLYGARAKGEGHVLNRERYRLFGGESGSRKDEAKTTGGHGKQFDQWVSFQGLKR